MTKEEINIYYEKRRDYICYRINKGEELYSIAKDLNLNIKTLASKCNKWKEKNMIKSIIKIPNIKKHNTTNANNTVKPLHKETNKFNTYGNDYRYDLNCVESEINTEGELYEYN